MGVRVRLFAAAREAAGRDELQLDPAPLQDLLTALRAELGAEFARRLAVCTVLVDGTARNHDDRTVVPAGAEVAVLPPVSGGARGHH
jgi:sulfur-carrier protein